MQASREQLAVVDQTLKREQELINAGDKTLADLSQAKSQVATAQLNVTNAVNALEISYLTLGQLMERQPTQPFTVQAPLYNDQATVDTKIDPNTVFKSALTTFPDVALFNLRTQAARKAVDVARGSFYPTIGLGASASSSYSYQFGYTAVNPVTGLPLTQATFGSQFADRFGQGVGGSIRIPIFNGFAARSSVRQARIAYDNARVNEQLNKNNLQKIIYQASADLRAAESRYQSTTNTFLASKDAFYVIEQRYNV
ncbi:MAG: TolC family protein, partial [Chitinophagaceae bacterium]